MDRETFVLAGWTLAVFAAVGIGVGLTGAIVAATGTGAFGDTVGDQPVDEFVLTEGTFAVFVLGPLVAMVVGLVVGSMVWELPDALVAGGFGSLFGFYVMALLAVPLLYALLGVVGSGDVTSALSLRGSVVPILAMGAPTGVVGAVTAVVGNQMQ